MDASDREEDMFCVVGYRQALFRASVIAHPAARENFICYQTMINVIFENERIFHTGIDPSVLTSFPRKCEAFWESWPQLRPQVYPCRTHQVCEGVQHAGRNTHWDGVPWSTIKNSITRHSQTPQRSPNIQRHRFLLQ